MENTDAATFREASSHPGQVGVPAPARAGEANPDTPPVATVNGGDGSGPLNRAGTEIPASLAARLGEAADGIRNGQKIYFVARMKHELPDGHDVTGFFNSEVHAQQEESEKLSTGKYEVFGPFLTEEDKDLQRVREVDEVIIKLKNSQTHEPAGEIVLEGDKFDAVFWSLAAVDKFLVPYYVAMGGLEEAQQLRKDFKNARTLLLRHLPGTRYTSGDDDPTAILKGHNHPGLQLVQDKTEQGEPKFIPVW